MSNIVHSPPYPCLDEGNLSFPEGIYYADVKSKGKTSIQLSHKLENAGLIQKLLDEGKAKYGCLTAVPLTGYRRLSVSNSTEQIVEWDLGVVAEPPIIRPIIVTTEDVTHCLDKQDDVASIWVGKEITLPKGARLARGKYLRSVSSFQSLLDLIKDEDLPSGCFIVQSDENNGFRFRVSASSDLFEFLRHRRRYPELYSSIAAHMVSSCLSILQREQGIEGENEKWCDYSNLKMLSEQLKEKDLSHWSDDDFNPEKVALQLYPLKLPQKDEEE